MSTHQGRPCVIREAVFIQYTDGEKPDSVVMVLLDDTDELRSPLYLMNVQTSEVYGMNLNRE